MNLTWKDVFNSEADPTKRWGHIESLLLVANMAGYRYFTWNGRVYELLIGRTELDYRDTGLTEEDLG